MLSRSYGGRGLWLAPQYWFFHGMTPEGAEAIALSGDPSVVDHIVGAPYREVFPPAARAHAWEVGRALQIDLLIVEDGVSFDGLKRVLQTMFERYDIHGATQRAEEWHFQELPQVRATIHEHELGVDRKAKPGDPPVEDLGRALA